MRWLAGVALLFGAVGLLGCLAAGVVTWRVGQRLEQANRKVFSTFDTCLTETRLRVVQLQQRTRESEITAQDLRQRVEEWAANQARQRLAGRLDVHEHSEKLAIYLQQAEDWIDLSAGAVKHARGTLELANSLGAQWEPARLDPLLDRLAALQEDVKAAVQIVDHIRQETSTSADGADPQGRMGRVVKLVLRIAATLGEIDERLGALSAAISELHKTSEAWQAKVHRSILAGTLVAGLLIFWMAFGQLMLVRYGSIRVRRPSAK